MNSAIMLARLRWRARRGLLENDLILKRFLDRYGSSLTEYEIIAFTCLLELNDNDFLALVLGRTELEAEASTDPDKLKVLGLLRSV